MPLQDRSLLGAAAPVPKIDWAQARAWEFHAPDPDRFPLLPLAYETMRMGGWCACMYRIWIDEVCVRSIVRRSPGWPDSPRTGVPR